MHPPQICCLFILYHFLSIFRTSETGLHYSLGATEESEVALRVLLTQIRIRGKKKTAGVGRTTHVIYDQQIMFCLYYSYVLLCTYAIIA